MFGTGRTTIPSSSSSSSSFRIVRAMIPKARPQQHNNNIISSYYNPFYSSSKSASLLSTSSSSSNNASPAPSPLPSTSTSSEDASNHEENAFSSDSAGQGWFVVRVLATRAALALGLLYVVTEYVYDLTLCEGPSMTPTLRQSGDLILIDKLSPRLWGLHHGDTIAQRIEHAQHAQAAFVQTQQKQNQQQMPQPENQPSPPQEYPEEQIWYEPLLPPVNVSQPKKHPFLFSYMRNLDVKAAARTVTNHFQFWKEFSAWMRSPIAIGDVVVVAHPSRKYGTVCKRVLALPGDQILSPPPHSSSSSHPSDTMMMPLLLSPSSSFSITQFTAPQQQQQQHYHYGPQQQHQSLLIVPDGHVWLEGDNLLNSSDSRHYGPVPASLLVGRVLFRVWPLRGQAWLRRGMRPNHHHLHAFMLDNLHNNEDDEDPRWTIASAVAAATAAAHTPPPTVILPAGYDGQHILRSNTVTSTCTPSTTSTTAQQSVK